MTKLAKALGIALLCAVGRAYPQFEGILVSRNFSLDDYGVGRTFDMTIWLRREMIKVRIPAVGETPGSTVIYRHDRKVTWVMDDSARTYFEVSIAGEFSDHRQPDEQMDKPTIERTKRSKKILGYSCEQVLLKRREFQTEVWGARGLNDLAASLDSLIGGTQGGTTGMESELFRQLGLFPMVSVTRAGGKVIDSQEITRIERRPLTVDLFSIPSAYKKQPAMQPGREN